jgi:hypothetical protein
MDYLTKHNYNRIDFLVIFFSGFCYGNGHYVIALCLILGGFTISGFLESL